MALTPAEITTIRRLFGYADAARETYFSIDAIAASIGAETETEVRTVLTRIATIETQMGSLGLRAGLKRAEEVEFYQGADGYGSLALEGDRQLQQLSALLALPIRQSAFRPRVMSGPCGRG